MTSCFHRIEVFCTRYRVVERLRLAERRVLVTRRIQKNDRCLLERLQILMNVKNLLVWCSVCKVDDGIGWSPRQFAILRKTDRQHAAYRQTELRLRRCNHGIARSEEHTSELQSR